MLVCYYPRHKIDATETKICIKNYYLLIIWDINNSLY